VIIEALGVGIALAHIKLKRTEWRKYISHIVSDWEWSMYQDL
jgi:glutamine synthetase